MSTTSVVINYLTPNYVKCTVRGMDFGKLLNEMFDAGETVSSVIKGCKEIDPSLKIYQQKIFALSEKGPNKMPLWDFGDALIKYHKKVMRRKNNV